MKIFFQKIIVVSILITSIRAIAINFCGIKNQAYQSGEKIIYNVYYHYGLMNVDGGIVSFTTNLEKLYGKPVYHLVGFGKTYPAYDWFYKVRDTYESYVDTTSLLPIKFNRNTNEDGEKKYNNIVFNHQQKTALCGTKTISTPDCIQDVLSAIYYARNINFSNLKIGEKIYFNMILDETVYPIYLKYLGIEKIKTNKGFFNTIKFKALLIEGTLFKGGENMTVWVSNDANKVPIRVESKILVGEVRADLIQTSNLRN